MLSISIAFIRMSDKSSAPFDCSQSCLSSNSFFHLGSHHPDSKSMLRYVSFPDVLPDAHVVESIKFADGDFMQAFVGEEGTFSVIATLFFLDTSPNIIDTLSESL